MDDFQLLRPPYLSGTKQELTDLHGRGITRALNERTHGFGHNDFAVWHGLGFSMRYTWQVIGRRVAFWHEFRLYRGRATAAI
jgi:hypothetical protein